MYSNKFIAVIKYNGNILREKYDKVLLPFGSEYSILLKNLESRRASVKVFIDGQDVLNGNSLIIESNADLELERFVQDSNKDGNKFKFIRKTDEVSKYRGDRIDDGVVRIIFKYEKYCRPEIIKYYIWPEVTPFRRYYTVTDDLDNTYVSSCTLNQVSSSMPLDTKSIESNNEGITVPGSISTQKFQYGTIGYLEDSSHTIIIRLSGYSHIGEQELIKKPITVRDRLICPTCGLSSKSDAYYCKQCGTCLV